MQEMESKAEESQKKSEGAAQKKSPFDLIFSQIQRKKSTKGSNENFQVKRFFRGFQRSSSKTEKEKEEQEAVTVSGDHVSENGDNNTATNEEKQSPDLDESGWLKADEFMRKFGKKAESLCINLSSCSLTAADVNELGPLLPFLPDVEEMDLSWNNFVGGSVKLLTPHLHHVSNLKVLSLSNCSLMADDASALGEALESIPNLEVLDLSWNSELGGHLSKITQHISRPCALMVLNLTECNLKEADGVALAQVLSKMPNLKVLDLSMNKELGCTINSLIVELKNCSSLVVLKLHSTGLQQDNIKYLSAVFQYWPYLQKLDLSCNKQAGGGFREAAARLTAFKHLQLLDIHQCCLSGEDVAALTQVIPLMSNLQMLDISSNKTVGLCPEHLFGRLRFLPKLRSVIVSNCNLKEESFAALAEASRYLQDLEILDLSWNKSVGGNLRLLLDTLKNAPALHSLMLSSCNLGTQDLAVLASAAQAGDLNSLQQLDIAYNDTIPDEGWELFFESLSAHKNIAELDISLRPASSRHCGPWFIHLISSLLKLPKLKELGMQHWVLSSVEKQQLQRIQKESSIHIHYD
ncbi:leucine-rich repeat-containing protein 31 [Rhinophrynus dorsalis]